MIYVLTLKTWSEYDRAHHTYGTIHWDVPEPCDHGDVTYPPGGAPRCNVCGVDYSVAGFQSEDSLAEPDAEGWCTARHNTRQSAIDGALRWYAARGQPGDALVLGMWGLAGWEKDEPFEVLAGSLGGDK
jgi:hypothetical protein